MTITKTQLDRLDALESKVSQAIETIAQLTSRCEELDQEKKQLERNLESLTKHNNDLSQQLAVLRAAEDGSGESEEAKRILVRIDRMLEKFGELQV